jgi:hypothetical protein
VTTGLGFGAQRGAVVAIPSWTRVWLRAAVCELRLAVLLVIAIGVMPAVALGGGWVFQSKPKSYDGRLVDQESRVNTSTSTSTSAAAPNAAMLMMPWRNADAKSLCDDASWL